MTQKRFGADRESKKALITEAPSNRKRWFLVAAAVCVVLVAGGIAAVSFMGAASGPDTAQTADAQNGSDHISHALALFNDGRAQHFSYTHGAIQIRYFVLKSSDGIVRAAFDACDVCWPAGKGYYQEGDAMVCRNCSRRFASVLINEVKGGCNPAPLVRTVENGQLVIRIGDIVDGSRFFDFRKQV
ncbi:MAG: DUF2318 domain-containing protein [Pseudomonadota bacterium]